MTSPVEQSESPPPSATSRRVRASIAVELIAFFRENGYWYLASAIVHAIGFVILALIVAFLPAVFSRATEILGAAPSFEAVDDAQLHGEIPDSFQAGDSPIDPSELNPDVFLEFNTPDIEARHYDDSPVFNEGGGRNASKEGLALGGLGNFAVDGFVGVGAGAAGGLDRGMGGTSGMGAGGSGYAGRAQGNREGLIGTGGTKVIERSVIIGLHWLYKHQAPAGNWSIQHSRFCGRETCGGDGTVTSDSGATALALLCFLGGGQTHKNKGVYKQTVAKGIDWLRKIQKPDGDLSGGSEKMMYSHGLATLALCEAFAMSGDPVVGEAAQKGIRFIERAQNEGTGGWRYLPGDNGDTSVTGWQLMALKSGQVAGLGVNSEKIDAVRRWLASVAKGEHSGLFVYQPYAAQGVTPSMTAVGLLCHQYLGMPKDDPAMTEGTRFLLEHLPDPAAQRDVYYWYYASLVMHNMMGPDWDLWNRRMRTVLVKSQVKDGPGAGSWDPDRPTIDRWGSHGGRHTVTTLSILSLEVYYRHLPLYKVGAEAAPGGDILKKAAPRRR